MKASQVLRIERAQGCLDRGTDTDNAFLDAWPQQCNPKLATKK
jgi:hypothetical protein